jgi:competence protein ComEA
MNNLIKDYFTFSKSERNGLIILLSIVLILVLIHKFSWFFFNEGKSDFSKFEKEISNFQKSLVLKDTLKSDNIDEPTAKLSKSGIFNPNDANDSIWKQFGLNEKQIKVIHNYLSKGGKFYKKEDLKKLYFMNEKVYLMLEPHININKNLSDKYIINSPIIIELNSADTSDLLKIRYLSIQMIKRIIKYRDLLGGFFRKEQLLEVYGFKNELFKRIEKLISVDSSKIMKLNINSATIGELNKSPYLDYFDAKNIVNFRLKNGKINNINQISILGLLPDEKFEKVKPYLIAD